MYGRVRDELNFARGGFDIMLKLSSLLSHTGRLLASAYLSASSLKIHSSFHTASPFNKMELKHVTKFLEEIAPIRAAESWDNVGLLLEPSIPRDIERLVITNDLTEQVMEEITSETEYSGILVVSYHPPIFKPLKRLIQDNSTERIIVKCLESKIAIYSPHTSLDNMEGGINDWLLGGIGEGEISTLGLHKHPSQLSTVEVLGGEKVERLLSQHSELGHTVTSSPSRLLVECTDNALAILLPKIMNICPSSSISVKSSPKIFPTLCGGKLLTLLHPTPLSNIVKHVKVHLQLNHLRLAKPYNYGDDPIIKTVAACAGSGGSVLDGVRADLLLTGEMSHHQVLAAVSRGSSVILCEHTNTERGYLQQIYKSKIEQVLGGKVAVTVATSDKDPLEII